jgi:ATP/maltotriose-dependent transcriptional regulator MalT
MTRVLSALGKAASFTFRGAAVTFGSTIFSCVVACQIEKGANRMIYTYFPYKFANVEAASGITQEELDLANMYYGAASIITQQQQDDNHNQNQNQKDHSWSSSSSSSSITATTTEVEDSELLFRYNQEEEEQQQEQESLSYFDDIRNQLLSLSTTTTVQTKTNEKNTAQEENKNNKFWSEGANATATTTLSSIIPTIIVPSQEIMACSMASYNIELK